MATEKWYYLDHYTFDVLGDAGVPGSPDYIPDELQQELVGLVEDAIESALHKIGYEVVWQDIWTTSCWNRHIPYRDREIVDYIVEDAVHKAVDKWETSHWSQS